MKPLSWTLISSMAFSAIANPIPDDLSLYTKNQITSRDYVTPSEVATLSFYAQYASASYCNSAAAVGSLIACPNDGCANVTTVGATIAATFSAEVTDQQGIIAIDTLNELIVVSFKGTSTIRNWIADFTFEQVLCDLTPGCLVHSGFLAAYEVVKSQVITALAASVKTYPTYKIVFTGHSMGAAVATYAAADFRKNLGYDIDLYTYASPRIGNLQFAEYVSSQPGANYRVTHLDDVVPRIPPMILNYRHTTPEYWIDMGNSTTTTIDAAGIKYCEGYSNIDCNAGTSGLDITAHNYYFLWIDGCGPGGIQIKRDQVDSRDSNMSDAALEAMLNGYVDKDKAFAEVTLMGDVWL